jgi:intracellular sulfur oxidation DsrE/DsrF family protein
LKALISLLGALLTSAVLAQNLSSEDQYYVVDIELQTAEEFQQLLSRAEQLLLAGVTVPRGEPKVTFVLHGPVLRNLLRDNYLDNKRMVDLAASLTAMEIIDVKACNTWMLSQEINAGELQPFIETVDYGPAEVKRLLESNYLNF